MHMAFLPAFTPDVPFVIVQVELEEQPGLRYLANLVDGPDVELRIGMPVEVVFERLPGGSGRCRSSAWLPGRHERSVQPGPGGHRRLRPEPDPPPRVGSTRRPDHGDLPGRHRRRRSGTGDIDGLTTGSLLPSSGGQAIIDGQSIVTSSYAGRAPRRAPAVRGRFPGLRPAVGVGDAGRRRHRLGLGRLRAAAPGPRQSDGPVQRERLDDRSRGRGPMGGALRVLGAAHPHRPHLPGVHAALRGHAGGDGDRGRRGPSQRLRASPGRTGTASRSRSTTT